MSSAQPAPGRLVLVSTPIGNLGDLSPRAAQTLAEADLVCCEDTRRTRELLTHAAIRGRHLVSLREHNEQSMAELVVERVRAGELVVVVSDAGTPAVSDPGARLVSRAVEAGIEVSAVPGPNAALAALVVSGFATDRFCFEGFLPRRGSERRKRLEAIAAEVRTVLIYESPLRVAGSLEDLAEHCGPGRRVAVARELTKLHEEIWRGTLGDAVEAFATREVRGEVVVVLEGAPPSSPPDDAIVSRALEHLLASGMSARDAASQVATELGVARRRAYELAVTMRRGDGNDSSPGYVRPGER